MKVWLVRAFAVFALLVVVAISIPDGILTVANSSPAAIPGIVFQSLTLVFFALVGVFISLRRPENAIGPLFCVSALAWSLSGFMLDYATHGLVVDPGSLPAADWLGVFGYATQSLGFYIIFTFLLLLFPTGHIPSPRWRPVFYAALILIIGLMLQTLFGATADNGSQLSHILKNPMAIFSYDVSNFLQTIQFFGLFIVAILCGASLIVRSRRATGVERQQIKWLGFAAMLCVLFIVVLIVAVFVTNGGLGSLFFYMPLVVIAAATGVSILRYRLFDIDVIIRRTLVYGLLTAILAGVYFVGVVGVQRILGVLTGQQTHQTQPTIMIVVTTLLVAALFQPLRHRLQRFIDRRFYRARYDARKTLDAFGASLRNDVELTHLTNRLLETVEQTMHPAHASLWIREPTHGGDSSR
ncbi:MAG TPA: hypothetical protein VFQ32_02875 [Ktedonobacterales bacterium]|nr:hypothetical protein [Ktedonobacterales bacterium]